MLGLSSGEEISTLDTRTESEWEIIKCICWLFWIVRPLTLMAELDSIVSAYRMGNKREAKHQFYCILYDTNVQNGMFERTTLQPHLQVCPNCQLLQSYCFLYEKKKCNPIRCRTEGIRTVGAPLQGCRERDNKENRKIN